MSQQPPPTRPDSQQPLPPPPPQSGQPLPQQPERVVIVRESGGNPITKVLKAIALPFLMLFRFLGSLISTIIHQMLRSVVAFIVGLALSILLLIVIVVYVIALKDSNFDAGQALTLALERIAMFFQGNVR